MKRKQAPSVINKIKLQSSNANMPTDNMESNDDDELEPWICDINVQLENEIKTLQSADEANKLEMETPYNMEVFWLAQFYQGNWIPQLSRRYHAPELDPNFSLSPQQWELCSMKYDIDNISFRREGDLRPTSCDESAGNVICVYVNYMLLISIMKSSFRYNFRRISVLRMRQTYLHN